MGVGGPAQRQTKKVRQFLGGATITFTSARWSRTLRSGGWPGATLSTAGRWLCYRARRSLRCYRHWCCPCRRRDVLLLLVPLWNLVEGPSKLRCRRFISLTSP